MKAMYYDRLAFHYKSFKLIGGIQEIEAIDILASTHDESLV